MEETTREGNEAGASGWPQGEKDQYLGKSVTHRWYVGWGSLKQSII